MIAVFAFFAALVLLVLWPQLDLTASALFWRHEDGFFLAHQPVLVALHWLATTGARVFIIILAAVMLWSYLRPGGKKLAWGISSKNWLFLLLALLIGPGLIANVGYKDHWGRARPREVTEFGGTATFSPALEPQPLLHKNGSFVAGDGAFGFFLPSFGYVTRRRSRAVFWLGMGGGAIFGLARLLMGAHFLSDILFAAFLMLLSSAAVHALMFGEKATLGYWRMWLGMKIKEKHS
jgi:lipid A 4'-phosphatase